MMNKLMPILAKAVVTLVFATISVLGVSAQAVDSQVDLDVDPDTPAILEDLDAVSIKYLEISDEVDGILDTNVLELSDYHIDSEVTKWLTDQATSSLTVYSTRSPMAKTFKWLIVSTS